MKGGIFINNIKKYILGFLTSLMLVFSGVVCLNNFHNLVVNAEESSDMDYVGTAINPLGTYDKVYFNTNLSSDNILDIASSVSKNDVFGNYIIYADLTSAVFLILEYDLGPNPSFPNVNGSVYLNLVKLLDISNTGPQFDIITNFIESGEEVRFNNNLINPFVYNFSGGVSQIDLSMFGLSGVVSVGQQNELLSSLISSSPFQYIQNDNSNNNKDIVTDIFDIGADALTGLGGLLTNGADTLVSVFYSNNELTIVGIALAISGGTGVLYFLFRLLKNWLCNVKGG